MDKNYERIFLPDIKIRFWYIFFEISRQIIAPHCFHIKSHKFAMQFQNRHFQSKKINGDLKLWKMTTYKIFLG